MISTSGSLARSPAASTSWAHSFRFHAGAGVSQSLLGTKRERSHEPVLVDVARAVREDLRRADADDELRLRPLRAERVVGIDRRDPVQPHPLSPLEVDEEQADVRVHEHVPRREVHAVAVVARERDRALVEHAHEAGLAALVRALRAPLLVGRGEEEHVPRLDERAVVLVDQRARRAARRSGRRAASCRTLLEPATTLVVQAAHRPSIAPVQPGRSRAGPHRRGSRARSRGRRGRRRSGRSRSPGRGGARRARGA